MGAIDTIDVEIHTKPRMIRFSAAAIAADIIGRIADRAEKRRSRATLRDLTDDQLRDVGLTRNDVRREIAKSFFWD